MLRSLRTWAMRYSYLPHVYDEISFSASLKGHHVQSLQSLPVTEVLEATNL